MNDSMTLYSAEDAVARWIKQAFSRNGLVIVNKREFAPEPEIKFGQVADIQRYVDRVLSVLRENGNDYNGRQNLPVTVRERNGAAKATYSGSDMSINIPSYEIGGAWALREMVVLHEIAHHLSPGSSDHGPDFRSTFLRLLENVGKEVTAEMMHESYCNAGLSGAQHDVAESTLDKIAKLLRQAEGTNNEAEASAFTAMAQKLATKHSIALAVARAAGLKRDEKEVPVVETYYCAEHRKHGNQERVHLLIHIATANDVKITIYKGNTCVDLYGFQSDIDVTKALYESLSAQMEFAYADLLKREPVGYEEAARYVTVEYPDGKYGRERETYKRKVHGTTRRMGFYDGFQSEVGIRLRAAKREAVAEAEEVSTGTALVLRDKELEVTDFYKSKIGRTLRSWGTTGRASGGSHAAGRAAGQSASLGGERSIG